MDLKEIDILGDGIGRHWYYRTKAAALKRLLGAEAPNKILDVGAASGFFTRRLLRETSALAACCVDKSYVADADEVSSGKRLRFRRTITETTADVVLLMDVLEHVDDDVGLLKSYVDLAPKGARFVISVPAFRFLWSGHDVFLEHKRRYSLGHLKSVVAKAGLKVEIGCYYFGLVFPLAAGLRLLGNLAKASKPAKSQLTVHNPITNVVLTALCASELPLMKANRIAGLTVFCVARKA